ncbi:MAG: septum formation initiator family protein [Candidatus Aminicenantes bacterium]
MREKKEKTSLSFRKKIIIIALVSFFLVLFLASFFGKKGLIEIYRAQKVQRGLLQEVERLEEKQRKLEREIEELRTNPQAVEKKAREKLWLQKPDEIVIVDKKK